MFTPRPAALAASAALIGILFIAACASRQLPHGGPGDPQGGSPGAEGGMPGGARGDTFEAGRIARPVALLFAGMDLDHDHIIDQKEISGGIAREWAALPVSARGTVSSVAITDWAAKALGDTEALPNPIAFDINLDGQVSEEEFRNRLAEAFDRLDRDQDGRVTHSEMLANLPQRAMNRGGVQGGPGGGGGRPPR